jgi:hypothetical protein
MAIDGPVGIEIRQANAEIDAESESGNLVLGRTVESQQAVRGRFVNLIVAKPLFG